MLCSVCSSQLFTFFFFTEIRGAASNSAYYGYPELWILRYPAQRYHAVPSPGFEPTTLWLRVRRPNHSATTLHIVILLVLSTVFKVYGIVKVFLAYPPKVFDLFVIFPLQDTRTIGFITVQDNFPLETKKYMYRYA
jgi:hypothetical protein